ENGVPLNTSYVDVAEPRLHYYPISIGQYSLAVYNSYVETGSEEKKEHFMRIADWFVINAVQGSNLGAYWLTEIPKPEYKVFSPWKSAFTQSRAISVLLRAWQITNEEKYLSIAASALNPFKFDISQGGVSVIRNSTKFYEEYVAAEPTLVLDGHIFSMLGLYDFIRAVPENQLAKDLFNDGINALIKFLPEFDMGYWLRFNLCQMEHYPQIDPCTIGYLRLVLIQLKLLYEITKNDEFIKYYNKFKRYDKPGNILRMYLVKYKALKKLNRL
ncbi:MAG: D-glucuronyl C5-epimerase family protein, partial [Bacteroidetes bacterium]|nr:D-glucuronyl C5-epimerase family protein [Bacteroidota bacterium]